MNRYILAGLAVAGLAGLILLPYPFMFDQAQYTYAARLIRGGAILYHDVWDPKQPGLFVFFLVAGRLFGFDEVGIHLFELLYLLTGIAGVTWLLRRRFRSRIALGMVPVLTVGAYYASIFTPSVLTQLEWLVGMPLFFSLWLCVAAVDDRRRSTWLLSGVLGGIAVLFKSLLLLVVLAIWATVLLSSFLRGVLDKHGATRAYAWLVAGALLAWAPFGLYVLRHDLWDTIVFTYLVYPPQAVELFPRQFNRLARAVARFMVLFSPLLLLAVARLRRSSRERADPLVAGLVTWIAAGFAVVLMQHWWPYHFYLLLMPLGILAAIGLDRVLVTPGGRRRPLVGAALLSLPLLFITAMNAVSIVRYRLALRPDDRLAYQSRFYRYGDLSSIVREVAFLHDPDTPPGPLYVLGTPVYLYRAGRGLASPIIGGNPEVWPPELWKQTLIDLTASRPPYVFVQDGYGDYLRTRGASLGAWIESNYRPLKQGSAGTWYRRSDLAE